MRQIDNWTPKNASTTTNFQCNKMKFNKIELNRLKFKYRYKAYIKETFWKVRGMYKHFDRCISYCCIRFFSCFFLNFLPYISLRIHQWWWIKIFVRWTTIRYWEKTLAYKLEIYTTFTRWSWLDKLARPANIYKCPMFARCLLDRVNGVLIYYSKFE